MRPGETIDEARIDALDWGKGDGLLPAVVQDVATGAVLMLGFMNADALRATLQSKKVTFFSRTKGRLWQKGETSGHVLEVVEILGDCDADTLLVRARPHGPTCHTGEATCFGPPRGAFLETLEQVIAERQAHPDEKSYTAKLFGQGTRRIAQKVGEEGLEVALAAVAQDETALVGEAADLVFHLLVLLRDKGLSLAAVVAELARRHEAKR